MCVYVCVCTCVCVILWEITYVIRIKLSPTGTLKLADKKSIYLPSTIKLVVETDESLGVDMPSVHMTAKDISWESMVDRWLHTSGAKLVSCHEELLKLLFHKSVRIATVLHMYMFSMNF